MANRDPNYNYYQDPSQWYEGEANLESEILKAEELYHALKREISTARGKYHEEQKKYMNMMKDINMGVKKSYDNNTPSAQAAASHLDTTDLGPMMNVVNRSDGQNNNNKNNINRADIPMIPGQEYLPDLSSIPSDLGIGGLLSKLTQKAELSPDEVQARMIQILSFQDDGSLVSPGEFPPESDISFYIQDPSRDNKHNALEVLMGKPVPELLWKRLHGWDGSAISDVNGPGERFIRLLNGEGVKEAIDNILGNNASRSASISTNQSMSNPLHNPQALFPATGQWSHYGQMLKSIIYKAQFHSHTDVGRMCKEALSMENGGNCTLPIPPKNLGRVYGNKLKNGYFIRALNAMSTKPECIMSCFSRGRVDSTNGKLRGALSIPEYGFYQIRLHKHGNFVNILIDDRLPVFQSLPYCARGEDFPHFPWSSLIEKAYAKLHNSYEALQSKDMTTPMPLGHIEGLAGLSNITAENYDDGGDGSSDNMISTGRIEEVLEDLTGGVGFCWYIDRLAADRIFSYLEYAVRFSVIAVVRRGLTGGSYGVGNSNTNAVLESTKLKDRTYTNGSNDNYDMSSVGSTSAGDPYGQFSPNNSAEDLQMKYNNMNKNNGNSMHLHHASIPRSRSGDPMHQILPPQWSYSIQRTASFGPHSSDKFICLYCNSPKTPEAERILENVTEFTSDPDFTSKDGYLWLRVLSFCDLFYSVHECRLVGGPRSSNSNTNNMLSSNMMNQSLYSSAVPPPLLIYPNSPLEGVNFNFVEHLWCFPSYCNNGNAPTFRVEVEVSDTMTMNNNMGASGVGPGPGGRRMSYQSYSSINSTDSDTGHDGNIKTNKAPGSGLELLIHLSQADKRLGGQLTSENPHVPILVKVYEELYCSDECSDVALVTASGWSHSRGSMCGVKVRSQKSKGQESKTSTVLYVTGSFSGTQAYGDVYRCILRIYAAPINSNSNNNNMKLNNNFTANVKSITPIVTRGRGGTRRLNEIVPDRRLRALNYSLSGWQRYEEGPLDM